MSAARPCFATGFYPGDSVTCSRRVDELVAGVRLPPDLPARPLGGLVPHAGWVYSGPTAAHLWCALADAEQPPQAVVLLGAVHVRGVERATVYSGDAWSTPLGDVAVDRPLADAIVAAGQGAIASGTRQHDGEHSLEVQAPLIRRLLPDVPIVPIAVPADRRALDIGDAIASAISADGRRVALLASSDHTHYARPYGFAPVGDGPDALAWSRANDRRLVDRALALDAPGVLAEADAHHNACGPGALAACIDAVSHLGATDALLLDQTTSQDVRPRPSPDLFVGYAAVLFA